VARYHELSGTGVVEDQEGKPKVTEINTSAKLKHTVSINTTKSRSQYFAEGAPVMKLFYEN